MLPIVNVIYALSQFVPGLLRWAGKDDAAEVADKAVQAAAVITGKDTLEGQIDALQANPDLVIQYQKAMNEVVIAQLEAETRQLEAINATMRAEYSSDDTYTKRWRPTMGYLVSIAWFMQMMAVTIVIVMKPGEAVAVINALASTTAIWSVALTILGVAIVKRSEDKQAAAGMAQPGIFGSLAKALGKR